MHHELRDLAWVVIEPMLPNNPRWVQRVNDRRVLNDMLGSAVRCPLAYYAGELWISDGLLQPVEGALDTAALLGIGGVCGRTSEVLEEFPFRAGEWILVPAVQNSTHL